MSKLRLRLRPTLISLPAFCILIALGVWQLDRLEWKTGLIAAREAALAAPAIELPAVLTPDLEFRRVKAQGRLLVDRSQRYRLLPRNGAPGYELLTPLLRAEGEAVLVNRGWRPEAASPAEGPGGDVALEGVLRFPRPPGAFAPEHGPAPDRWLWYDLPGMERSLGLKLAPAVLELQPPPGAGLTNNHLQYAITWFALAAALAAIYLVSQWERRPKPE